MRIGDCVLFLFNVYLFTHVYTKLVKVSAMYRVFKYDQITSVFYIMRMVSAFHKLLRIIV